MSYLALARKWRPKKFNDIVGQEHVVQALTNALNSEKMHHAYLFSGTRGIGKTTIARILAKAFNCQEGMSADICEKCENCLGVDEGRFVDLIEVDAASKTKVDDTRELLDNVQFAPTISEYKIYLIDEVHMLSKHSFNALLKTLEEPPPHVRFFLATTDPQKLPITVLSRCLQFNLKRISPKLILERIKFICNEEKIKFEDIALAKIARAADGSLRDALSLLDQSIAYSASNLTDTNITSMLGSVDKKYIHQIMISIVNNDASELIKTIDNIGQYFPNYENLLIDLAEIFQRLAILNLTQEPFENNQFEYDLSEYDNSFDSEEIQLNYQIALMGRRDLDLAPSHKVGFEMCLLRMIAFKPHSSDETDKKDQTIKSKENVFEKHPKSTVNIDSTEKNNKKTSSFKDSISIKSEKIIWSELVDELDINGATKTLADNCSFDRKEGDTFYIILDKKSSSYYSKERESNLSQALSNFFKKTIVIKINAGDVKRETPNQEKIREKNEKRDEAILGLQIDPKIKEIENAFSGASLDSDSIKLKNEKIE